MLSMNFKTGGAAFRDDNGEENDVFLEKETARLLRKVADAIEYQGKHDGKILDINGNTIGSYNLD